MCVCERERRVWHKNAIYEKISAVICRQAAESQKSAARCTAARQLSLSAKEKSARYLRGLHENVSRAPLLPKKVVGLSVNKFRGHGSLSSCSSFLSRHPEVIEASETCISPQILSGKGNARVTGTQRGVLQEEFKVRIILGERAM